MASSSKRSAPSRHVLAFLDRPEGRPKDTFSSLFDNADGKADIVLRSSDGVKFALRRALLEATSTVFEDMLAIPQPRAKRRKASPGSPPEDGLDVVQLSETADALEIFLRHVIPQAYLSDGAPPTFSADWSTKAIELLTSVLEIAIKYDTPVVLDVCSRLHLAHLNKSFPLYGWAVSCQFERLEQAREALRLLAEPRHSVPLEGAKKWDAIYEAYIEGRRDFCLGDLPLDFVERVPSSAARNFCAVHAKVVASRNGSYTWLDAADEFEL